MQSPLRKSTWLKRLLLLAAIVPVSLLWGELFTRTLLPQNVDSRMNIFQADPIIGYIYEPHAKAYEKGREYRALYRINNVGLRDRDYGRKENGTIRVLLLGDSFSVSHGLAIEDSLSRQLEAALQAIALRDNLPVRFEVVNAAVGGYSPYNYWKAYERWAGQFRPDAVVVALSPDDYDCSNEGMRYVIDGGETLAVDGTEPEPQAAGGTPYFRMLRKWLSRSSEFYVLMRNFLYYNDFVGSISLWMEARADARYGQLEPYLVPQTDKMSKAWSKTFSYLRHLHENTKADGVALAVIPLPLKLEIIEEEYQTELKASGRKSEQFDIDQPLKEISLFSRAENIPVLDPRSAMRKRQAVVPCYFVYDGHWNEEGVRAAASQVAAQWRVAGLPPWHSEARGKKK
jgi:hypothetical protein